MKIEITPEAVQTFRELNLPSTITISKVLICFNSVAKKQLSLQKGSCFAFEFSDGLLYYKDSNTGFKITGDTTIMLTSSVSGIGAYIDTFIKKGPAAKKFKIGEFKDGKRLLTLIESK